jgi:hypothetical protein
VVGTVDEFRDRLGLPAINRSVFALAAMGAIPKPPARLAPHELVAPQGNIVEPANQLVVKPLPAVGLSGDGWSTATR